MSAAETVVNGLKRVRSHIANYQQCKRGISKSENYSFVDLVKSLFEQFYGAVLTIFTMLVNLMPLFDGFVVFVRFSLDNVIEIIETPGTRDKAIKSVCFLGELIVLLVILYFIITLLLIPIIHLILFFVSKLYNASFSKK